VLLGFATQLYSGGWRGGCCGPMAAVQSKRGKAPSDTRAKLDPTASTSVVCALGFYGNEDVLCAVPYQAKIPV
jgi:hypothetical protein